jgi:hypothetical protein
VDVKFEEKWAIHNGFFHAGSFQHSDVLEVAKDDETGDVWLSPMFPKAGTISRRNALVIKAESIDDLIEALRHYQETVLKKKA